MGFTKLDENILLSSVMTEEPCTFKIWICLLAACHEDGVAPVSAIYLESVCRLPIDTVLKSLDKLSSPDPLSRSINDDGRRIERVDGGYRIINYHKYREKSLRSAEAERKRLYRENINMSRTCPDTSASASSSESFISKEDHKRKTFEKPTVEQVKQYCMERKNSVNAEAFIDFYTSKGWLVGKTPMKDWKAAVRTWEKNNYGSQQQNQQSQTKTIDSGRYRDI